MLSPCSISILSIRRSAVKAELGDARKQLAKLQRQRDTARARYLEKVTAAREDALEHVLGQVTAQQQRVDEIEAKLRTAAEPPQDAMLDTYNALRKTLEDTKAPLNDRLRSIFDRFIVGVVNEGQTIAALPVLRDDVIESHADPEGMIRIISTDGEGFHAMGDDSAKPVMLLVPPPSKRIEVDVTQTASNAWA